MDRLGALFRLFLCFIWVHSQFSVFISDPAGGWHSAERAVLVPWGVSETSELNTLL